MRLFKLGILCAALFAGGCATDYSWQRRDGGPAGGQSFDQAISECRRISGRYDEEIMRRCMERYGFVWAPSPYESYCYNSDCRYSEYRPHRRNHRHHRQYDDD